jgi:hypothetical protein
MNTFSLVYTIIVSVFVLCGIGYLIYNIIKFRNNKVEEYIKERECRKKAFLNEK